MQRLLATCAGTVLFALLCAPAVAQDAPQLSQIEYEAFDQRPGAGWRKFADAGRYMQAAEHIDRYMQESKALKPWQHRNLNFHAGQCYAFAEQHKSALARFKSALIPDEPADAPLQWNAYVQATMAFIEKDRGRLLKFRDELRQQTGSEGNAANLKVIDRLVEYFDQSYAVAYGNKGNRR